VILVENAGRSLVCSGVTLVTDFILLKMASRDGGDHFIWKPSCLQLGIFGRKGIVAISKEWFLL
jgi:hypothetical protein